MPIAEIIGLSGKLGLWTLGKPYIIPGREPIGLSSLFKGSEIISLHLSSFMRVRTASSRRVVSLYMFDFLRLIRSNLVLSSRMLSILEL